MKKKQNKVIKNYQHCYTFIRNWLIVKKYSGSQKKRATCRFLPFLGPLMTWQLKNIYISWKYMLSRTQNIFYFFCGTKIDWVLIFSKKFPFTIFMVRGGILTKISVLGKIVPGSAKKRFFKFFSSDVLSGVCEASWIAV